MRFYATLCFAVLSASIALAQPAPENTANKKPDADKPASPPKLVDEHDYARRVAEVQAVIAKLQSDLKVLNKKAAEMDAAFAKAEKAHPGREAYVKAMAETELVRREMDVAAKEIDAKRAELEQQKAKAAAVYADLEVRLQNEIAALSMRYGRRVEDAKNNGTTQKEIDRILREHEKQRSILKLRYDNLKSSARTENASAESAITNRINELEDEYNRLKRDKLDPAMVKAAPFQAFLNEWNAKREPLNQAIAQVQDGLAGAEKRLKSIPKPRPAEAIAKSKLLMAKNLKNINPDAARRRFAEIISKYPNTKAAKEAKELLAEMDE